MLFNLVCYTFRPESDATFARRLALGSFRTCRRMTAGTNCRPAVYSSQGKLFARKGVAQ
jgi:hypothetical protein